MEDLLGIAWNENKVLSDSIEKPPRSTDLLGLGVCDGEMISSLTMVAGILSSICNAI